MTSLDMLLHVVEHAKRWDVGDKVKQFGVSSGKAALTLPDGDVELFIAWAKHLDDALIRGYLPYYRVAGLLHVSGRLRSTDALDVYVAVDGEQLRAAGLNGELLLAQVEQFARMPVPA